MRITRLLQGAALAMAMSVSGTPQASAATVNTVVPDESGAVITTAGLANLSENGISFFNNLPFSFVINGTSFGGSNTLTVLQPPTPSPYLFGTFLDGRSQDGIVELLYSLSIVNPASGFGNLALVALQEVGTPSFFDENTIADLANRPTSDDVTVDLTIRSVAPIPLPAGFVLLLTGLGALGLARLRAAA